MLLLLGACAPTIPDAAKPSVAPEQVDGDTSDTSTCVGAPPVVVNELVAANLHGVVDGDGDTSDWLELMLAPEATARVDLAGWTLIDEGMEGRGEPGWTLPAVTLGAGETLLVWASEKDRADAASELHASFAIDDGGDEVRLAMPDGCVADRIDTGRLYADVSLGRASGGSWAYFLEPTPGAPNATESRPGFAAAPTLTPGAGFYADPVSVVTTAPGADRGVRVTLDGSVPDGASPLYTAPILLDAAAQPVVVRAVAFAEGLWPSRITTATYSTDPSILAGVRVISLTVDPPDLWDPETGIYVLGPTYEPYYPYFGANFWEVWERDLHVEIFGADGSLELSQDAGIQIAGGYSRAFDQRNFEIIARSGYGPDTFDDPVFPDEEIGAFHKLYLRNGGDWCGTQIVDASVQALFRDGDGRRVTSVDAQAYTPTLVYLNGTFWGLYELKERLDEWWIADHRGEDPTALDRVKVGWTHEANWELEQGTWDAFEALDALVATTDLADDAAWAEFSSMVDVDNLAASIVAQGWIGNTDWWGNNLRMWRPWGDGGGREGAPPPNKAAGGRWRWMVYDFGHGWPDWHYDHLAVSTAGNWTGLPIAAALRNPTFRDRFVNIHADFLNTSLVGGPASGVVRALAAEVRPVMARQRERWCSGASMDAWEGQVAYAESFARNRPAVIDATLMASLDLSGHAALSLDADPVEGGTFHLAVVDVAAPFTGTRYLGVPVTVTAQPAPGWVFDGWSGAAGGTEPTITLPMDGDTAVTARFVPKAG